MRSTLRFLCSALLFVLVLSHALALGQLPKPPVLIDYGPIPPELAHPGKIFLANGGADSGLFPTPFSGDTSRGYSQFYKALDTSGQYRLVSGPAQADLVLVLQSCAPKVLAAGNSDIRFGVLPFLKLTIYDRQTDSPLWTFSQPIRFAFHQKSHDRKYDQAVDKLLSQFEAITGVKTTPRPTPKPHS
uniref:Uncharacterized protein n=1 Tax=mine drainage metagenome TaxID=410659 RepID=E6PZI5_9ZZZZ